MALRTFVAVGDSFTEGLQDGAAPDGPYVGWADRVAWALSAGPAPTLRYANLAVRGQLLHHVVAEQLVAALATEPDLLSFHAGGNDVLRPGVRLRDVGRRYDRAVRRAVEGAGTVLLFTVLERSGSGGGRAADRLADRIGAYNELVRAAAATHDALLVDLAAVPALADRRLWHEDRLHLSTDGHRRVAAAVLETLGHGDATAPGEPVAAPGWWRQPLPTAAPVGRPARVADDLRWVGRHLLPWVGRRLRGTSSGDGRVGKRPRLARP